MRRGKCPGPKTGPQRTWAYGTRRSAVVLDRVERPGAVALCIEDGEGDAHILLDGPDTIGQRGDRGHIEFRRGGPTGGYWHFSPEAAEGVPGA